MPTITESIGRVLSGRYRIESALGSGASAHVFAAWDVTLQRRVAVKVLHAALAADVGFLRRFQAEAQAAAALTDPHVLAVYDWGEDSRGPFLVLEFLGGGSLRDLLDNHPKLSIPQAVSVGLQAAEGLAYAHGRGFVHRDVKPANLLFDENGRLRVGDFGLARALAEAALTEPSGTTVGTARYAAPEQALGKRVDGRADVYSLALVLYESVTGVVPFTSDTTIATLMARVGAQLPGHDSLGPLAGVLQEAAAPEADDRLDAAKLVLRLRKLQETLPAPKPLPVAGAPGPAKSARRRPPAPEADRTEHGVLPSSGTSKGGRSRAAAAAAAGAAAGAASGPGAAAPATGVDEGDVEVATGEASAQASERVATLRRAAKRRWLRATTIVVLCLAILVGAGLFVAMRAGLFTPTHRLPTLESLTVAQAEQHLKVDHFTVRGVGHESSLTAPVGSILRQSPQPGAVLKQGSHVNVVLSSGPPPVAVPVLTHTQGNCPAITSILSTAHLRADCSDVTSTAFPAGTVISWTPKGQAPEGSDIVVEVSSGPPIETIPSLSGSTCMGAQDLLTSVGLTGTCNEEYTSTGVPVGQVIDWNPTGTAPEGAAITVDISKGPPLVTIPNVNGMTVAQAIGVIEQNDLNPGTDQGALSGHVFATDPSEGTQVPEGDTITIYSK